MPDTGLNLANLKEHLRKNWVLYIVGILITVVLTNLLWTSTTPQIPTNQSVLIFLVDGYTASEALDGVATDMLERLKPQDDTLRLVEFQNLMFSDPENNYASMMVLMARLAVGECDIFLASGEAMEKLIASGTLLPLDEYYADGWLRESGLEPYYATVEYEEGGQSETLLMGFKLDSVSGLRDMGAMNNEGAYLAISALSDNLETSMKAAELLLEDLAHPDRFTVGDAP